MSETVSWKYSLIGVAFLCVSTLVATLAIAQYNRAFDTIVPITVKADRSGLLMEPGAAVKLNGVEIGSVGPVTTDGDGAVLSLHLQPEIVDRVPADVSANLVPATLFGAKYVELRAPRPVSVSGSIASGTVIDRTDVTVELDHTFDALMRTLRAVPPTKLNASLTAVADSLRGKGSRTGDLIKELNDYLAGFNPHLPELAQRPSQVTAVADDYREITDELTTVASNLGGTSDTVVERQREFDAFLRSLTDLGNTAGELLERNGDGLVTTLDTLQPTTRMVARYSPVLPCFFSGVARNAQNIRAVTGGPEYGGSHTNAHVTMSALPGIAPYRYPQDLSKKGVDTGPDCHGLPDVRGIPPYVPYDTGTTPYPNDDERTTLSSQPLALLLFGPLAPRGGGR